ncbi:MAG: sulfotransferase [Acidimicrobiales bacterium]
MLGTQRGGTTIAGRMMGQVPGFAFLGEFRKLWQVGLPEGRRCGCGKGYDDCEVWSVVIPKVLGATDVGLIKSWQLKAAPDRLSSLHAWRLARAGGRGQSAAVRSYAALLAATYVSLAETMQTRVLVDTSKLPADAVLVSRLEEVDSFFIELVRDPRGTVYSAIRRSGKPAGFHPRQGVGGSAGWLVRHLAASALRREVGPSRSMVVTYERLVADPQQVLSEIAAFVGEPGCGSDVMVDGSVPLDVAHTPIGDGRFGPVCVEFTQDDRWVTALSTADRLLISALTRPLARHFGYFRPRAQRLR